MNNIQEKDWAEDDWSGHTGMDSDSLYCSDVPLDDGEEAQEGISSNNPAPPPFVLGYQFIRRGEVAIVFSSNKNEVEVRALFLSDPLLELTESALQLHKGSQEASVVFIDKTGEHHLLLKQRQDRELDFELRCFEKKVNSQRETTEPRTVTFKGSTTVDAYCLQVLKILQQIEKDPGINQYKTKWINADFPLDSYRRLKMEQDSLNG